MYIYRKTPLIWRFSVCCLLCVLLSGVLGSRIIADHSVLQRYGFQYYGSIGKAGLFGMIAFVLLGRDALLSMEHWPWQKRQCIWFAGMAIAALFAWTGISHLEKGSGEILWAVIVHSSLIGSICGALLGCFGIANLRKVVTKLRRELVLCCVLAIGFYAFLFLVYGTWPWLAVIVLWCVQRLMRLNGLHTVFMPPYTLVLDKFAIDISQYCSGIESIALFNGLYAVVGLLDWRRLQWKRYSMLLLPALAILFVCNIVRVYLLIIAGYYINPTIAFSLFHTYAGMVFFICYSAVFWAISYRWMLAPAESPAPVKEPRRRPDIVGIP